MTKRPLLYATANLRVQGIAKIRPCQWSQRCRRLEGITIVNAFESLEEQRLETLRHALDHDAALGTNAALARVDQTAPHGLAYGQLDICVAQHHVGVTPAQLEHDLLELRTRDLGHCTPRSAASRQRDRGDARVANDLLHPSILDA